MQRPTQTPETQPPRSPSDAGSARSGWAQTFTALGYPNFRLLWVSTILISAGNWIQQVTLGWLAYYLTQSPLQVSIVLGLRAVPMLMAPIAGVIADRFDRRRAFMVNQAALALLAGGFATVLLLDVVEMWHVYLFSFLAGAAWSLNNPLRQTLVSNSVPRETLMNAIALHSMAFNSMRMIGPAVGGGLIFLLGPGPNFLVQGVLYVAVFLMLIPYRAEYGAARLPSTQSPLADLIEGIKYVRGQRITLITILLSLVPTLFLMSFIMTQMPVYAAEIIGDDSGWSLGLLMTAMGVGGFLGTLFMARFSRIAHKGRVVLIGIAGAAVGTLVVSQATTMATAVPILIIQQLFFMMIMTTNNVVLQTITPDSMRGRVMGLYMIDVGMQPLGGVFAGIIATAYSVSVAWVIGATIGLVVVTLVTIFAPSFRRLQI